MKHVLSPLLAIALASGASADAFNRKTDWMAGRIGIFQHHLYHSDTNALAKMRGCDVWPHDLAAGVRADARSSNGLIRNVNMTCVPTATAVSSAARDTLVEANRGLVR